MWRCNNSAGYGSVPVKIHGWVENVCLSEWIVCAYDYLSPSFFVACEYLNTSRHVKHVFSWVHVFKKKKVQRWMTAVRVICAAWSAVSAALYLHLLVVKQKLFNSSPSFSYSSPG